MQNHNFKSYFWGPESFGILALALTIGFTVIEARANTGETKAPGRYDRTEPFTVDYKKGRTYQNSYSSDPGAAYKLGMSIEAKCQPTNAFDFDTTGFGPALSRHYFSDSRFDDFNVVVLISIPLQKLFVLDRREYISGGSSNGLVYAWRTSTGYHDKHFSYSRKEDRTIFGQKGGVQIYHQSRDSALKKLRALAGKSGAKFHDVGGRQFVTFAESPTKKVEYIQGTTKVRKDKAEAQGLEIIGTDAHSDRFVMIRRHMLNYTDYFHTEPGHFVVQNGFSSRHISGESDGAVDSEEPYMPWAIFFNRQRGMATHAAAYRGTLGSTGSHGCVRLLEENACRLFHLVGQTEQAKLAALNEKTGEKTQKIVTGHRALYIVSDTLGPVEKRFLPLLQK